MVEQIFEPEFGEGLPGVDAEELPVPDAEEDLAEDDVAELFGDFEEEEEDEPGAKRARANSSGDVAYAGQPVKDKKVSWADLAEAE